MSDSQKENQSEINKMKAKIMYDEIIIKYNDIKDIDTEENVINKIIELNFDENQVKEYYNIQRIYDEIDYEIEDEYVRIYMKDKIKELHCNRELILRWLEEWVEID